MSLDLSKNSLVIAYFCDHAAKEGKLNTLRKRIGNNDFKKALNLLEEMLIIEYPMEYPIVSRCFPRGFPYPGSNFIVVSFVYFPAWIQAYMHRLDEVKSLLTRLEVTKELVDDVRKEVSKLDIKYNERLKEQLEKVNSWQGEDQQVIKQLLNPRYQNKIRFSNSTVYWES